MLVLVWVLVWMLECGCFGCLECGALDASVGAGLEARVWVLESGRWSVDAGAWVMERGCWSVGAGGWVLVWRLDWVLECGAASVMNCLLVDHQGVHLSCPFSLSVS